MAGIGLHRPCKIHHLRPDASDRVVHARRRAGRVRISKAVRALYEAAWEPHGSSVCRLNHT